MKKKHISLIIAAVVLAITPIAAEAATLSLAPSTGSFDTATIFSVQILLDTQSAPIEGVDIRYLNYNPSVLEVQDENTSVAGVQIAPGTLMPVTAENTVDAAQGTIAFSQTTSGSNTFTGTGTLATVRFRTLSPATSTSVTFDFTPGNTSDTNVASGGADVLSSVTNGSYALTTIAPPPPSLLPVLSLSPSSGAKQTGNTFSVDIMLDTRGNTIDGADVQLSYPPALLKIVDDDPDASGIQVQPGALLPNTMQNSVSSSGLVRFAQTTNGGEVFSGSGVLATLHFQAIAPGTANATFLFTKGRTTDTNVSLGGLDLLDAVTNASFTIAENGQPPVISDPRPSGTIPLASSIKLEATTNEAATCRYATVANTSYEAMGRSFSATMGGTEHSLTLYLSSTGFQIGPNTFFARCRDRAGAVNTADTVISFTVVADTAAPVVNRPLPDGTFFKPRNIHISVLPDDETGVLACKFSRTPNISYDAMTRYLFPHRLAAFFFEEDEVFSLLISGGELSLGQNNFYVRCKDRAGNANTSDTLIAFTLAAPPRFTVPLEGITNVNFQAVSLKFEHPTAIRHSIPPHPAEFMFNGRLNSVGVVELLVDNTAKNVMLSPASGYTITASADRRLKRKLTGVTLGEGASVIFPRLLAGDLNNDTVVNSIDLSIMISQWAGRSFFFGGGTADINRDGSVNTIDWGYLRKNWLITGE